MSPPARKSVPTKELLRQVATRSTGRLIAEAEPDRIEVFLMGGEVVGAVTVHDEAHLLRQAIALDLIPQKRAKSLQIVLDGDHSIFGPLLDELPVDRVDQLLLDRFRENLVRFVASAGTPAFEAMPGVFVDNMQMGHVSPQLIEWAAKCADRARGVSLDLTVVGSGRPADVGDAERRILDSSREPLTVSALIQRVAGETWLLRSMISDLLEAGLLIDQTATSAPSTPEAPVPDPALADTIGDDDALVVPVADDAPQEAPPSQDEVPSLSPNDSFEELPGIHHDDRGVGSLPDELGDLDDLIDEPSEEVERPVEPVDLSMWLDPGEDVSDDDLAFFEDHENDRGAGQGGFTTETHNLDKVDVVSDVQEEEPPPEEEILEAGEAVGSKYGAPVLSDHEALDKIEVVNDVLRRICAAFDAASGSGRGMAAIQLLVDGAPAKFATILHDLEIDDDGEVPPEDILGNLAGRPLSEQRLVLNGGLKDLIDRALSTAADELPDEAFDEVYESVAGYNGRLGL